jgi:hypothetical protein
LTGAALAPDADPDEAGVELELSVDAVDPAAVDPAALPFADEPLLHATAIAPVTATTIASALVVCHARGLFPMQPRPSEVSPKNMRPDSRRMMQSRCEGVKA